MRNEAKFSLFHEVYERLNDKKKRIKLKLFSSGGYWGPCVDSFTGDQSTVLLGTERAGAGPLVDTFLLRFLLDGKLDGTNTSLLTNEDDIINEIPDRESINLKALFSCAVVKSSQ